MEQAEPTSAWLTITSLLAALSESAEEITPSRRHDSGYRRFVAILSYLYEHATHTDVAAISERFGYSPAHLSRLFRRYVGETISVIVTTVLQTSAGRMIFTKTAEAVKTGA